jgi:hypothetical protein
MPLERETMRAMLPLAIMMLCVVFAAKAVGQQSRYSKAVQQACMADYKKYCGEYGIETAALRTCMDKNGQALPRHACVHLLTPAKLAKRRSIAVKSRGTSSVARSSHGSRE